MDELKLSLENTSSDNLVFIDSDQAVAFARLLADCSDRRIKHLSAVSDAAQEERVATPTRHRFGTTREKTEEMFLEFLLGSRKPLIQSVAQVMESIVNEGSAVNQTNPLDFLLGYKSGGEEYAPSLSLDNKESVNDVFLAYTDQVSFLGKMSLAVMHENRIRDLTAAFFQEPLSAPVGLRKDLLISIIEMQGSLDDLRDYDSLLETARSITPKVRKSLNNLFLEEIEEKIKQKKSSTIHTLQKKLINSGSVAPVFMLNEKEGEGYLKEAHEVLKKHTDHQEASIGIQLLDYSKEISLDFSDLIRLAHPAAVFNQGDIQEAVHLFVASPWRNPGSSKMEDEDYLKENAPSRQNKITRVLWSVYQELSQQKTPPKDNDIVSLIVEGLSRENSVVPPKDASHEIVFIGNHFQEKISERREKEQEKQKVTIKKHTTPPLR